MRDYSSRSPHAPRPFDSPPPRRPTRSIRIAVACSWTLASLTVVTAILTYAYQDQIASLASVSPSLAQLDAVRTTALVGAVFGMVVFGSAWAALAVLLRRRVSSARVAVTVLAALSIGFGLPGLLRDQPAPLRVLAVGQLVLQTVVLLVLWRRDATDYLRPQRRT